MPQHVQAEVVKLTAALATSQREVVGLKTKCDTQKKALEKALSKEMETVGMSRPQSMGATAQVVVVVVVVVAVAVVLVPVLVLVLVVVLVVVVVVVVAVVVAVVV